MFSNKYQKFLISALVFLLPTQLAYHFWPDYSLVFGIRVDYLSPTIYLTDILALFLVALNFKKLIRYKNVLFLVFIFAVINTLSSFLIPVSMFRWFKIFEFLSLAIIIKNEDITKPLYCSLIFFSLIGITQFLIGSTTNLFYLLGERTFNINTPAIALTEILGRVFMRAYSTFPHPNALAGYLGLSTVYLVRKKFKFNWLFVFVILCFILTFSLSAFIAIIVYFVFKNKFSKYWVLILLSISLIFPFMSFLKSYDFERINLGIESGKVISKHFWMGSGLGTFTKFSSIRQPVHNLFLLIFSELGIIGIGLITYLLLRFGKNYKFILFVLIIGLFDHYFLTIQQNMLLLFIISTVW